MYVHIGRVNTISNKNVNIKCVVFYTEIEKKNEKFFHSNSIIINVVDYYKSSLDFTKIE